MKHTEVLENELYWYRLEDGTWTAMCRVGDRAYWIGDEKGVPIAQLTGEWFGPIEDPGPVVLLRQDAIDLREAYFELRPSDLD